MADHDDPTALRRQGMADAAIALTLQRRIPVATVEDIGSWLGLRQRELIDAIKRMKDGDQILRRLIAGHHDTRTSDEIRAEIDTLKAELATTITAERAAAREAREAERQAAREAARAERARIRAEQGPVTRPASSYANAGPCPDCGKEVRNLGVHRLSHTVTSCPDCDFTGTFNQVNGHRRHHHPKAATDAA